MSNPPGYTNQPGPGQNPYGNQPYGQPSASGTGPQPAGNFDDATVLAPNTGQQQPYGQPSAQPYGQPSAQPYGQPSAQPYGQPSASQQPTFGQSAPQPPSFGATSQPSGPTAYSQPQPAYGQPNQPYTEPGYATTAPTQVAQPGYGAAAGATQPPVPPKKKRTLWPWLVAAGVLLLVLLIVLAMVVIPMTSDSPEKAMKGYMQALVDGDSKKALSYLDTDPQDKTFLTDDVLKQLKDAGKGPSKVGTASRSYINATIAGEDHYLSLSPHKVGGKYKLTGLTTLKGKTSMNLKTAGVTIKPGDFSYPVFPGVYEFKSDNPYYDLGTSSSVDATSLSYTPSYYESVKLTTAGVQAARDAAKKSLNDCLAQAKLAPANCPYAYDQPTGGTLDESTVKVELEGSNPIDGAQFMLLKGMAQSYFTLKLHVTGTGKLDDGSPGKIDWHKVESANVNVDLNQSPAKVTWQ